jgi:pyridoxal phosphate-dependent aminotransferase EpsN
MGPEERALLLDAFDSNWIAPLGPHVDAFEKEAAAKVGVAHAAALSSGTAALHLALILLGVGPGDEVFVADLTFAASVNVIRYVGATPVFIDADAATWTMDPDCLAEAMAERARNGRPPKVVLTVDLYGQCADYERIAAVCQRYDVPILQDASEAFGATYKGRPAGQQGAMAALSFNGNKIITTSGGGMLLSSRADWIVAARHLATQAREPAAHYEHRLVGYNYRLSNLLAAVGRGQLRVLDERVAARQANFAWYRRRLGHLPGWTFMPEAAYGTSNRWLTCVTIDPEKGPDREKIRLALEREDIEARPVWKPMHLQPVFSSFPVYGGKVGRALFENGLCLPSGSSMSEADRERVAHIVTSVVESRTEVRTGGKAGGVTEGRGGS